MQIYSRNPKLRLATPARVRDFYVVTSIAISHVSRILDEGRSDFLYDPDVDSEDINCVSQMFISEKAGKNCNEQSLGRITRNHDLIQCLSNLPYIAPLLDLNVKSRLHATFPTKMPNRSETDRCPRIDASGINNTTSPFLGQHSEVASHLHGLVSRQKEAPSKTTLEALVKFGSTARLHNLQWEAQDA